MHARPKILNDMQCEYLNSRSSIHRCLTASCSAVTLSDQSDLPCYLGCGLGRVTVHPLWDFMAQVFLDS